MPPLIKVGASYNYKKGQADAMQPIDFLRRVLPAQGIYFGAKTTPGKRGKYRQSDAQQNISDLDTLTTAYAQQNNTFYATGTFKTGASREADNVDFKKTFYIDIDCGPDKKHKTLDDIKTAWEKFKKETGILPPNMVVYSGNGYHYYWVLDRVIPRAAWQKVADALKQITQDFKLDADDTVTASADQILRVPGTKNVKDPTNPKDCRVIDSLDKDYNPGSFLKSIRHLVASGPKIPNSADTPKSLAGLVGEIGKDLDYTPEAREFGPQYFKYGKDECLILKDMLETGGEHYSEPAWMHALGYLALCEDGHDYIHDMSKNHPEYSARSTERKWDSRLKRALSGKHAPTRCGTFSTVCGTDKCAVCPHNGRIKNPAMLFYPPHSDIELPWGYYQADKGIYFRDPRDADGENISIHHENITKIKLFKITDGAGVLSSQLLFDIGDVKDVQLNANILGRYTEVHAALANQQVFINLPAHNTARNLVMMMNSWIQELSKSKDMVRANSNFGWQKSAKKHGFTVGGETTWDDGTVTPTLSTDHVMVSMYTPTGELKEWKQAANYVIGQDRQAINCAIASAFAAPLVCFTGERGLFMSIVSKESGVGKSMALNIAAGVWGNPHSSVSQMDDTHNSMMQKMGTLNHLPGYWDEIRMLASNTAFAKSLFGVSIGKVKGRLNADATRKAEPVFQTMAIAASNDSLIAHVDNSIESSDAGRMRVMEFSGIKPVPVLSKHEGAILAGKVSNNYGRAGAVYAKYLVNNHDKVEGCVKDTMQKLYKKLDAPHEERFWVALLATTLVGAGIANSLGLTKFDMKAMQDFLIAEFKQHRKSTNTHFKVGAITAPDIVTDFVNSNSDYGRTYKDIDAAGASVGAPLMDDTLALGEIRTPIMFEYGKASGTYKIVKSMFNQWLAERKKNPASVLSELDHATGFFSVQRCAVGEVASGTRGKPVPCILIRV